MQAKKLNTGDSRLPGWVPTAARNYLAHTEDGQTIRALARQSKVHASTILRQVRRFETLRDDPLIDGALRHLSRALPQDRMDIDKETKGMKRRTKTAVVAADLPSESHIEQEALRILRRMAENGALLAVARDMEMGVVVRDGPDGVPQRIAVVERSIAEALALKDWIQCADPAARIARYHITGPGRAALKRIMTATGHAVLKSAQMRADPDDGADDGVIRHLRSTLAESPLSGLARRRDKDGAPFLDRTLVAAGERLREDFELSRIGAQIPPDWEAFLTRGEPILTPDSAPGVIGPGQKAARDRMVAALTDLGPGLADVVLRCCCLLEGLENLEKRMGWSARSGKIVLRIALQRLQQHYLQSQGQFGPKIG